MLILDTGPAATHSDASTVRATGANASCPPGCAAAAGTQAAGAGGTTESSAQAAFNPFGTVGVVVHQPAPAAPQQHGGDWSLTLVVTVVALALIGRLLRKSVD